MSTDFNSGFEPGRRHFLRGAMAVSALVAARSAYLPTIALEVDNQRHFAPVKVARNRVIREVVGLRPYRSSGFVVETERLGDKLLIHNYGHGGAGVTLSWGTAALAVELLRPFLQTGPPAETKRRLSKSASRNTPKHFAVLGCGVNGLSTARLLQRYFQEGPGTVTIYARDLPPETTSNVAGAFWYPASAFEPENVTARFTNQFQRACEIQTGHFRRWSVQSMAYAGSTVSNSWATRLHSMENYLAERNFIRKYKSFAIRIIISATPRCGSSAP
jgi:D-amino-acid oxidase